MLTQFTDAYMTILVLITSNDIWLGMPVENGGGRKLDAKINSERIDFTKAGVLP